MGDAVLLDEIEPMYADELFAAVSRALAGQSTPVFSNGKIVAVITPAPAP